MQNILRRIAEKLAIHKRNVELVKIDNQLEMIDTLKVIEKNTSEKPEKPEKIDLSEVVSRLDNLTEEVKKKEQSQYDLQIDSETKAKLKGDKGDKGDAGKSVKPTKAELEAIIRAVVPEFVPTQEDLELLLRGMDIVAKTEDLSKVQGELNNLFNEVEELKKFDPDTFSKETIKKALGFIPSRSGGGVLSVTSSDGSVVISSSMAKGKGVVDLSVVTSGGEWGTITGTLSNQTDLQSALDSKLSTASASGTYTPLTRTLTINGTTFDLSANRTWALTKSDVGLANADNTSDVNKPVSTAQATADGVVQAFAIQRGNHTGTQLASTISDFASAVRATVLAGFALGARTTILATDTILEAFGKIQKYLNDLATVAFTGSASDLSTGTLPAGRMPALTGDITTVVNNVATTLATVNGNVGSFGLAGSVSQFVVNAKGLITSAVNVAISITASQVSDFATTVRATVLTGLSLVSTTVISATDTVLVALGSLQAQITALTTTVSSKVASVGATGLITSSGGTTPTISTSIATSRIVGRTTAGTGVMEELTGTQATTLLDVFTSVLKGLVPASGGGTTNYLRADGTWAPVTASTPDTILTKNVITTNTVITAGYSAYIPTYIEIADTITLEIGLGSTLEIG